jgi:4-hydroxy-3-methylbut-2-enyl diphosphate reductase
MSRSEDARDASPGAPDEASREDGLDGAAARADERRATPRSVTAGRCEIVVARYAGYCYGVERALRLTEDALAHAERPVATLGPIIHNPSVVRDLTARGAGVVDEVAEAPEGTLVVRTHGVAPEVVAAAHARGLDVVDATCPFVAVAQRKARALHEAGYTVVILGEHDHPEVVGLQGFAGGEAIVVAEPGDAPAERLGGRKVGVVVQTTQTRDALARLAATLAPLARELLVYNTVCDATEKRQSAACELAAQVDVVIVVGGRNSANTTRLVQLCRGIEARTHHVETAAELQEEWVAGARRVGVTAGASTPDREIEATIARLREICGAGDGD